MKSVDENIETLSKAILSEAEAEAKQIKADAEAKAEAIRLRAQQQAEAERAEILQRASAEAERLRSQVIATTQLKARTQQLEYREKLLDQVFAAARQQLPTIKQWSDYDTIVLRLLREAIVQLKAEQATVKVDSATQTRLSAEAVAKLAGELKVSLQIDGALKQGTGVIVETSNGRMHYDNTLETRLNRLQNILRSPVYHLLMGETL
jgi:V/A-type H+/Na+-transporting ATPase subunit E